MKSLLALIGLTLLLVLVWNIQDTDTPAGMEPEASSRDRKAIQLGSDLAAPSATPERDAGLAPSPELATDSVHKPAPIPVIPNIDTTLKSIQVQVLNCTGQPVPDYPVYHWQGEFDTPAKDRRPDVRKVQYTNDLGLVTFTIKPTWFEPTPWNPKDADSQWNVSPYFAVVRHLAAPLVQESGNTNAITLQLPDCGELRFELVRPSGEPYLEHALLRLTYPNTNKTHFYTFRNGFINVVGFPPSMAYSFQIRNDSGYAYIDEEHGAITPSEQVRVHQFTFSDETKAPTVTGRLLYPDGTLVVNQTGFASMGEWGSYNLATDGEGRMTLPLYHSEFKKIDLLIRTPFHFRASPEIPQPISPGANDLGDIYLEEEPCTLSGTLLMPNGRPMEFTKLYLESTPPGAVRSGYSHCMTGSDGQFTLYEDLPDGFDYRFSLGVPRFYKGKAYVLPEAQPFTIGQRGLVLRSMVVNEEDWDKPKGTSGQAARVK